MRRVFLLLLVALVLVLASASESELNKGKAKTCFVMKDAKGNTITDLTIIAKQKKLMYENFDDRQLCDVATAVKAKDAIRRLRKQKAARAATAKPTASPLSRVVKPTSKASLTPLASCLNTCKAPKKHGLAKGKKSNKKASAKSRATKHKSARSKKSSRKRSTQRKNKRSQKKKQQKKKASFVELESAMDDVDILDIAIEDAAAPKKHAATPKKKAATQSFCEKKCYAQFGLKKATAHRHGSTKKNAAKAKKVQSMKAAAKVAGGKKKQSTAKRSARKSSSSRKQKKAGANKKKAQKAKFLEVESEHPVSAQALVSW